MLAADRIQLNTVGCAATWAGEKSCRISCLLEPSHTVRHVFGQLEQMGPFLAGLWMHAIFVSAANATIAGSIYVAVRLLYPFVVGSRLGRGIRVAVLAVTVPNYGAIIYLIGGTLIHLL